MDARIEDRPMPPPALRRHPGDRRRENARTHGLYGVHAVAADEDPAAFRRFRSAIVDAYRPRDDGEVWIVAEIAETMWRTRRLRRIETRLWNDAPDPEAVASPALKGAMRIEAHLDLRFSRMLLGLERHRRLVDRWNRPPTPPTWNVDDEAEDDGVLATAADENEDGATVRAGYQPAQAIADAQTSPASIEAATNGAYAEALPHAAEGGTGPSAGRAGWEPAPTMAAVNPPPDPLPANPQTRDDFARLARARLPVVREAAALLKTDTGEAYDQALRLIGQDMRRWWEMRVTRTQGVRETWNDISRRHPFWENNRTPRALRDWLTEIIEDDRNLLDEIEKDRRKHW